MLLRKRIVVQSHIDKDTKNRIYVPYIELYEIPLV